MTQVQDAVQSVKKLEKHILIQACGNLMRLIRLPRLWQPVSLGPTVVVVEARGGELGAVDAALADANLGRDHIFPNFLILRKFFFHKKACFTCFDVPMDSFLGLVKRVLLGWSSYVTVLNGKKFKAYCSLHMTREHISPHAFST